MRPGMEVHMAVQPLIEVLESRQLLSAAVQGTDPLTAILVINGTNKSDTIRLVMQPAAAPATPTTLSVELNGAATPFDVATFAKIQVFGGNGHDTIRVDEVNGPIGKPVTMRGGNGKDLLVGASEVDVLYGGNGNDNLQGGAGMDSLYGQNGNDKLDGGADADLLDGGRGNDVLSGDGGGDTLIGGPQQDRIRGGAGTDTFDSRDGRNEVLDRRPKERHGSKPTDGPTQHNGKNDQ